MVIALLVRHGETTWNRDKRIQGWAPTGLTDRGRTQAEKTGQAIAESYDLDSAVVSDLRRCCETAENLLEPFDVSVEQDSRWRERDFGVCQGLHYDEFGSQFPEYSISKSGEDALDRRPERGESVYDMRDRVVAAWTDLVESAGTDDTILVVTHGGPLVVLLGHLQDRTLYSAISEYSQANCAVNKVQVNGTSASVVQENTTVYG